MKARCGVVLAEISPTKTTACRVIGCDHAAPASAEMTSANSSRRQPRISNRCRFGKGSELRRHVRKTRAAIGTKSSRSNGCSNVSMLAPSLFSGLVAPQATRKRWPYYIRASSASLLGDFKYWHACPLPFFWSRRTPGHPQEVAVLYTGKLCELVGRFQILACLPPPFFLVSSHPRPPARGGRTIYGQALRACWAISNTGMLAPSLFSHAPGGFRQAFFRDAVTAIEFVLYRGHEAGWFCGCFYATDGAAALARAGRCRLRAVVAAEEPPFGAEDE